jgi:heptosyltransferase-1/heptosyltransferase-2
MNLLRLKKIFHKKRLFMDAYDFFWRAAFRTVSWMAYLSRRCRVPSNPKRILVIRVSGMGDVIKTTPVVRKLRHLYPNAQIYFLTSETVKPILVSNPNIDRVLTESDERLLSRQHFDWVVNLQLWDTSHFVKRVVSEIKYKVISGSYFDKRGRYRCMNKWRYGFRNTVENFLRGAIGLPYQAKYDDEVSIFTNERREHLLKQIRRRYNLEHDFFVGINLGTRDRSVFWYRDYSLVFVRKLIEALYSRFRVIIIGMTENLTKEEAKELDDLEREFPMVVNLVDKLDLEELILIIRHCSVFVTPDSGPLHIAMAVKTPVVALFATDEWKPIFSGRKRGDSHVVILGDLECVPCKPWRVEKECLIERRARCFDAIPMEKILFEVESFLQRGS